MACSSAASICRTAIRRPGPKFDYKLRWFERLIGHAAALLALGKPVVLAGDYNVMPTDLDVYAPERWLDDALFRPEVRDAFHRLVAQGWTDALRTLHPGERIYTFWDYFRNAYVRERRAAHRPPAAEPVDRRPAAKGRGRSRRARLGKDQRSCPDLDRTRRRESGRRARTRRPQAGRSTA